MVFHLLGGEMFEQQAAKSADIAALTFGTQYRAAGVTLPTTTVVSKTLYLGCIWNSDDTKLDVVAAAQEI